MLEFEIVNSKSKHGGVKNAKKQKKILQRKSQKKYI